MFDTETITAVVHVMRHGSEKLTDPAFDYLAKASRETAVDCFFCCCEDECLAANSRKRVQFLEALRDTTQDLPAGYLDQFSGWLARADSHYDVHLLLSLAELSLHPVLSELPIPSPTLDSPTGPGYTQSPSRDHTSYQSIRYSSLGLFYIGAQECRMELNPYQSPAEAIPPATGDDTIARDEGFPVGLIFLAVLAALHIAVAGLQTLGGLIMQSPPVMIGGAATIGFHTAILIGVLLRQEWARILMIWLCYVGVVAYALQLGQAPWVIGPLIGLEVLTLLFAHSRRVRETTRRKSLAQAYVYRETAPAESTEE